MSESEMIKLNEIQNKIYSIRGSQVIIDRDLAELYNVSTKILNQAVKRNLQRFPDAFRFQLIDTEKNELVTNCDRLATIKHSSVLPHVYTEQGVAMLSTVLHSDTAINISIQIMQVFVEMREFISSNTGISQRIMKVEQKQIEFDEKFEQLLEALESKEIKPKQGIFFDGQIFDAYQFVSDLIRSAKESIILIDNYVDDTVLIHLTKRNKDVKVTILTKIISRQLALDIKKFNEQYPDIEIKEFKNAHDRFIIIDNITVYHFGASLKDLGKKWFAFSKMDIGAARMLEKLSNSVFLCN